MLLPIGAAPRFFTTYAQADEATRRRARGLAALKSLFLMLMGQNGDRGLPGGKSAWAQRGPPPFIGCWARLVPRSRRDDQLG